MTEPNSTPSAGREKSARTKPAKPYPDFPLYPHPAGYWAKKIRGRMFYFGRWEDGPDAALDEYLKRKDDLHAGRTPREERDELTVKDAVNAFLAARRARVEAGELTERSWQEYRQGALLAAATFGKRRRVADLTSADFARLRKRMAERWGPLRLGVMVAYVRSIFKYAWEAGLLERPVTFGPDFVKPSKKVLRLHRAKQGARLFRPEEVRRMLAAAGPQLRAMILLGINGGLGNTDCARLSQDVLDLERGWLDYPRPKTGVARRIPLWPETVAAIREAVAARPAPHHARDAGLAFLTGYGRPWARDTSNSPLSRQFARLLHKLDINGRKGLNFYSLRHTFRTIADEARDQPACDMLMGHTRDDMASVYRERIGDDRLRAVAEHVRQWLFGQQEPTATPGHSEPPPEGEPDILPLGQRTA
jgi:integrase